MDFGEVRAMLLDLDGTVYRGNSVCPGAVELVSWVRRQGLRTFFLSNNSRAGGNVVADKLSALGMPTPRSEVITSAELLVRRLARFRVKGALTLIGSPWLAAELSAAGWRLDGDRPDVLAVGLDHQFDYAKLRAGVQALLAGATFIAANRDPVNPIEGTLEPGCGSLVAALEAATMVRASCVGKPSLAMLREALARLDLRPCQTLMVGDSLVSDMELARRGRTHAALTLSGQTSRTMVDRLPAARRPELVVEDLAELLALWKRAAG